MPGDSEHPVTLGDLFVRVKIERGPDGGYPPRLDRPATVADLVSALRAEGVLVVEKVEIEELHAAIGSVEILAFDGRDYSPASAGQVISPDELRRILDALAEAQPKDDDYYAWQRANEAPTVYSSNPEAQPLPPAGE